VADLLREEDVNELLGFRDGPCVSVFLPTHRTSPESEQDPIRLKNLLNEAERRLVAVGLRTPEAGQILDPGRRLLDLGGFWSYQSDGLALFLAPGRFRLFRLPLELPELVVVAGRFHLKPLLALLSTDRLFYVLALSQNEVRLLEGTRQHVDTVELQDVPTGIRGSLKYDDLEKERTFHVAGAGGRGAPVVFHGHGIGGEVDKGLLERYLREVDAGLWEVLRGRRAPLVVAGVGYERGMFRKITRYPNVLDEGVEGNPEGLRPEALHERAWAIVEPVFARAREEATGRYQEAAGRGAHAAADVETIARAALQGRVEILFVPVGEQRWGTIDPQTLSVVVRPEPGPGDEDLLDRAAVQTLITSGTVFAVQPEEVPGPGPAAALLRY
jgi:hypothetical protein